MRPRKKELRPLFFSRRQRVPLERISFIDALRWLRDSRPDARLSDLIENPWRPNRLEPRVIKRRMKEYNLMQSHAASSVMSCYARKMQLNYLAFSPDTFSPPSLHQLFQLL